MIVTLRGKSAYLLQNKNFVENTSYTKLPSSNTLKFPRNSQVILIAI